MLLRPNLQLKHFERLKLKTKPPRSGPKPVVFAVDTDPMAAEVLLGVAHVAEVQCEVYENCAELTHGLTRCTPDMVLVDVTTDGADALKILLALSQRQYRGTFQFMNERGVLMAVPLRHLAELHGLNTLHPLFKPLDPATALDQFEGLASHISQAKPEAITIEHAIASRWLQFWYQPKINLRTKTLVGLETFVRLFHPHKGLMSPASLLKDAGERALLALAEESLIETARVSTKLFELGLNPTIATNVTSKTLLGLQIPALAREFAAKTKRPPNWVFDIDEDELARDDAIVRTLDGKLRSLGIKLAIDNFTGRSLPRSALRGLPISELKLGPIVVARCASDPEDAHCKKLIDLAHSVGSAAVAMGVESASQSSALQQMGCDVGQGFFFGQPLPLEQIVAMIEQRSVIGDGKTYAERKKAREAEAFGTS